MDELLVVLLSHALLATFLFFAVNWVGRHAVEFGYTSMTLFETSNESLALNLFLRAMSPAVFMILVSATAVAIGHPAWRFGTYGIAIFYYTIRTAAVFVLNRQRLINWFKFILHSAVGMGLAMIAYRYLIIPNRSLLPNLQEAGNELWLAILAFLYAVTNKVVASSGPAARRKNQFVKLSYMHAVQRFGHIIDGKVDDKGLKLIVYAVLIYEDYARPVAVRAIERLMFWKKVRTTGIMQVSARTALNDSESVVRGVDLLIASWAKHASESYRFVRARKTVGDYNADDGYISRVFDVAEILAKRSDVGLRAAYEELWADPPAADAFYT